MLLKKFKTVMFCFFINLFKKPFFLNLLFPVQWTVDHDRECLGALSVINSCDNYDVLLVIIAL